MQKTTYVFTVFDKKRKPLICGIHDVCSKQTAIIKLYAPCYDLTLHQVDLNLTKIREIILRRAANGMLIFPDFQRHIEAFALPRSYGLKYNAYDMCLPCVGAIDSAEELDKIVRAGLQRMCSTAIAPWMLIVADAALVYCDLQERGIVINYAKEFPVWSQTTFSGRSKCEVVPVQGFDESYEVTNVFGCIADDYLHFDWIAADLSMLAVLANDDKLLKTFESSDPYTYLEQLIGLPRADCKQSLLSAINSLDHSSQLLSEIFTTTGAWLFEIENKILKDGYIDGVMGRRYHMSEKRTKLAVLNAYVQGGVALGMKLVLKRVWDKFGAALLVEIHDSLVCTSKPEPETFVPIMDGVAEIMSRPFAGVDNLSDAFFPVKISRGSKWKQWKPIQILRKEGIEDVSEASSESNQTATESDTE